MNLMRCRLHRVLCACMTTYHYCLVDLMVKYLKWIRVLVNNFVGGFFPRRFVSFRFIIWFVWLVQNEGALVFDTHTHQTLMMCACRGSQNWQYLNMKHFRPNWFFIWFACSLICSTHSFASSSFFLIFDDCKTGGAHVCALSLAQ